MPSHDTYMDPHSFLTAVTTDSAESSPVPLPGDARVFFPPTPSRVPDTPLGPYSEFSYLPQAADMTNCYSMDAAWDSDDAFVPSPNTPHSSGVSPVKQHSFLARSPPSHLGNADALLPIARDHSHVLSHSHPPLRDGEIHPPLHSHSLNSSLLSHHLHANVQAQAPAPMLQQMSPLSPHPLPSLQPRHALEREQAELPAPASPASTSTTLGKRKVRVKRGSACNSCRKDKKACDGQRSCAYRISAV